LDQDSGRFAEAYSLSGIARTPRSDPMATSKVEDHRGIGFPVGYAVSGILLTVFGYFAMILAQ
jgi:hypothetical protein